MSIDPIKKVLRVQVFQKLNKAPLNKVWETSGLSNLELDFSSDELNFHRFIGKRNFASSWSQTVTSSIM